MGSGLDMDHFLDTLKIQQSRHNEFAAEQNMNVRMATNSSATSFRFHRLCSPPTVNQEEGRQSFLLGKR